MKFSIKMILGLAILTIGQASYAGGGAGGTCIQTDSTIQLMGLDDSLGTIFAAITPIISSTCGCNTVRFSPANTNVDKALEILLAAKLNSRRIRVDFLDAFDCDSAYRVYVQ